MQGCTFTPQLVTRKKKPGTARNATVDATPMKDLPKHIDEEQKRAEEREQRFL